MEIVRRWHAKLGTHHERMGRAGLMTGRLGEITHLLAIDAV